MVEFPADWRGRMRLPVVAAPMFLASGPELVTACCRAGVIGTFPALNQRTTAGFAEWLTAIEAALAEPAAGGCVPAPYGVNLIVHQSNARLAADLDVCAAHRVPLVITSMGAVRDVVERVHGYGGRIFHDIATLRHAEKAMAAGVDGLIVVAAGAGGHSGTRSPFAIVGEVRRIFSGTVLLGGAITTGRDIAAALTMGADLAYIGTRFLATSESRAGDAYKAMVLASHAHDVVFTPAPSGVAANYLRASLAAAGLDVTEGGTGGGTFRPPDEPRNDAAPWRDVWSAGHGAGNIEDVLSVAELIDRLARELRDAAGEAQSRLAGWTGGGT